MHSDIDVLKVDFNNLSSLDVGRLAGCYSLIHTAACSSVVSTNEAEILSKYRKINRDITLELAKLAAAAGIKRFVFLSSIKVNGDLTQEGKRFSSDSFCAPNNPYALSKYEAEKGLLDIARNTDMEVVIIRPPLVYGPKVKANFSLMTTWVKRGIPLPFSLVDNRRSLIALDNLIDFIIFCSDRERSARAANEIFLISDGEDISTSSLLLKIAEAYGLKSKLFPFSVSLMKFIAKLLGKKNIADRLFGNLQIDSSKAKDLLDWEPVIDMDGQLRKMAEHDQKVS